MREQITRGLAAVHLDGPARAALKRCKRAADWARRTIGRADQAMIDRYLATHPVRKLHIGCDDHILDGWLNADLLPQAPEVIRLDATQPFPLHDAALDFIYSEHMIEHIPHAAGLQMLAECCRVLKPGGRIRISTPDLAFVVGLYCAEPSELQRAYIDWSTERFIPSAPRRDSVFVINNFVRDWGHQFIYDERTLVGSLAAAGFQDMVTCQVGASEHDALSGLENEARMPPGFLRLESLIVEGTKP